MITHNKENTYTGFLGNRLFQIASTIGIAIKNDQPYAFRDNGYMSPFKNFMYCHPTELMSKKMQDVEEATFGYQDFRLNPGTHYNMLGYLQSRKYFAHCEEKIRHLFVFRDNYIENSQSILNSLRAKYPGKNIVGLHIRMGDYMNLKEHHTCLMDTNYYFNACNSAGLEESLFLVFSNDTQGADEFMRKLKARIPSLTFEMNQNGNAAQDMCAMSLCDGMIIANSSMSWWGAFLGEPNSKFVMAPQNERWFGPAYTNMSNMPTKDIIPDNWKQIIC